MTIGARIHALRKSKGYTQEYIADRLGVTRQAVSKWEQDQTSPDTWNLIELAKLLDSSVEHITLGKQTEISEAEPKKEHIESFCGRFCNSCKIKVKISCSGCKSHENQKDKPQCDISNCCRSRGLEACWQCKFSGGCKRLTKKDFVAEKRLESVNAELKIREIRKEIVLYSKTWISILPIIAIIYLVTMEFDAFIPFLPLIPGIAYAFCLIKLRGQSDSYKTAAILMLFVTALQIIAEVLPDDQGYAETVLGIVAVILNLARLRCEYSGHQDICTFFNCDLTDSYSRLWKWYLICPSVEIVALVFIRHPLLFFPALIVLIASLVGVVLVHGIHIRNLFRLKKLIVQEL